MFRIGRILALLVLLVGILWASTFVLPGLVSASGNTDATGSNCTYIYLTVELGEAEPEDRQRAITYENLTGDRRDAFDQRLAADEGAIEIEKDTWIGIYERPESRHRIIYNGTVYRARPILRDCADWERYENGTIPKSRR